MAQYNSFESSKCLPSVLEAFHSQLDSGLDYKTGVLELPCGSLRIRPLLWPLCSVALSCRINGLNLNIPDKKETHTERFLSSELDEI